MNDRAKQILRLVFFVIALLILIFVLFGIGIPGLELGAAGEVRTLAIAVFFLLLCQVI